MVPLLSLFGSSTTRRTQPRWQRLLKTWCKTALLPRAKSGMRLIRQVSRSRWKKSSVAATRKLRPALWSTRFARPTRKKSAWICRANFQTLTSEFFACFVSSVAPRGPTDGAIPTDCGKDCGASDRAWRDDCDRRVFNRWPRCSVVARDIWRVGLFRRWRRGLHEGFAHGAAQHRRRRHVGPASRNRGLFTVD